MTICPKCGRTLYRGTKREVEPTECALEDGASCRAYVHGVEVGSGEPFELPATMSFDEQVSAFFEWITSAPRGDDDPLHPTGRCECSGEGSCDWCLDRCESCGKPATGRALDDVPLCRECGEAAESDHGIETVAAQASTPNGG